MVLARGPQITPEELPPKLAPREEPIVQDGKILPLRQSMRKWEKRLILEGLRSTEGNRKETARQLGILRELVGTYGKGFCMLGGSSSFGRGGWQNTPVADVLPIDLQLSAGQIAVNHHLENVSPSVIHVPVIVKGLVEEVQTVQSFHPADTYPDIKVVRIEVRTMSPYRIA